MATDQVDALVIFGATGDLAKLETFPALVGLVQRGVLDVPVIGVAKSGWGLAQFRDYATASLKLNNMDPNSAAAQKMLSLLRYVDGDLGDEATIRRCRIRSASRRFCRAYGRRRRNATGARDIADGRSDKRGCPGRGLSVTGEARPAAGHRQFLSPHKSDGSPPAAAI